MSNATVRTGVSAVVDKAHPDTNYGTARTMTVYSQGGTSNSANALVWLKSPAPLGASIMSATLYLYITTPTATSVGQVIELTNGSWATSKVTWNNQPGVWSTPKVSATIPAGTSGVYGFDVTSLVQAWANGTPNYGFTITTGLSISSVTYSSALVMPSTVPGVITQSPSLLVEWDMAPSAPTDLVPDAGASVAASQPVLSFNYNDPAGSTTMAACQVQIDPAANWSSPAFDTGTVASSTPELDLSTTSYAGLGSGASTYWRVRVQDSSGFWSPWSVASQFQYTPGMVITLYDPSGNTVGDNQPIVTWTTSGGTQQAFRVVLANNADPSVRLYDSGRITSASENWTIPDKIITSQTITYKLDLYVWDTEYRQATSGVPTHAHFTTTFKFVPSAAANPITHFMVSPPGPGQPGASLSWRRNAVPDQFVIWRDGVQVQTVTGSDAQVSVAGTLFGWRDWTAQPGMHHTYQVTARESGLHETGPIVSFTPQGSGVWIVEPSQGLLINLISANGMQPTFAQPEQAGTYYSIGGGSPTRVTQGVTPLTGTMTGRLTDCSTLTAKTMLSNIEWLRSHPETPVHLFIGNTNVTPAVIGGWVIAPPPDSNRAQMWDRMVTFSFWAQDQT